VSCPLDPEEIERLQAKPAVRRLDLGPGQLFGWVAAGICVAVLGALAVAARPSAPTAAPAGFAIERSARARVEQAYSARRARLAVEAWQFAEGRWPGSLRDVTRSPLWPDDALAASEGRPYYYEARGEGVLLLAPER
jgi:hypothetical protein